MAFVYAWHGVYVHEFSFLSTENVMQIYNNSFSLDVEPKSNALQHF